MQQIADRVPVRVLIREESDVVIARKRARQVARQVGLPPSEVEAVATAVTEVARNIVVHAKGGEIFLGIAEDGERRATVVIAKDQGPGIADLQRALEDGYSTANGLGLGLSGARRLMDDFEVATTVGQGTTVTMKKWAR